MTKLGIAMILLAPALVLPLHAAVPTLSFEEVEPGMKGTGRTVFDGQRVEEFDVEILGKVPAIGPDQDLILARCAGGPLGETGVMAGMSGSPVMIDGKLIGAIAYTWGFSTEAVAGITPIGEMLAIAERPGDRARAGHAEPLGDSLGRLHRASALGEFFAAEFRSMLGTRGAPMPTSIPLAVSGMTSQALDRLMPDLAAAGFLPVQAGGAGASAPPPRPLEPGSAVGVKMIRGDVEMTATGTVTWVDGADVLAFGHPLFGLGSVDLPLTGAEVQALLPSLQQSSKIATPLGEVGALREDRASGIAGRLGAEPSMIPVRLILTGATERERTYSFDIADDPLLSPLLLYASLTGILASKERAFGSATITIKEGSRIKLEGGDDVELDNLFAGRTAFDYGTGIAAYILHIVMNNTWTRPEISGVNLILDYEELPRSARIRRASLGRHHVHPGETVRATVVVRPYRGPDEVFERELTIPASTPPGRLTLHVGGAASTSRAESTDEPVLPQDLSQMVRLINQLRRNSRVYILATREDSGVTLSGNRLPNLPPSVASVLSRPAQRGNLSVVPRRSVLEEAIETGYAIEGSATLVLEVHPR
jgi:hypothetical protein